MVTNIQTFFYILMEPFQLMFMKDPCKQCLVKACCSDKCEMVADMEKFFFPDRTIKEIKQTARLKVFSLCTSLLSISIVIYSLFK